MKIKSISIENFRSFKNCTVNLENYTSLVGSNGAGKSTVLYALNIFFQEAQSSPTNVKELTLDEFHNRDSSQPIKITVTFCELSDAAQSEFKDYYRQGELVVSAIAEFNELSGVASVKQFGQRRAFKDFGDFFKAHSSEPVAKMKEEYAKIRLKFGDIPNATSKNDMFNNLREYEEKNPKKCELILSQDQFYGVSRGKDRLEKYVQWIYVPAVKDATDENVEAKDTALGKLLSRTVRANVEFDKEVQKIRDGALVEYGKLLKSKQSALDKISNSFSERLTEWAHPDATARIAWTENPRKSVQVEEPTARIFTREGEFEGDLSYFGHGLQRSYLLALLQELASVDDSQSPTLILGCEEPELYQHPPQARHLGSVLERLSNGNAQIILTTHSPYFVSGRYFEGLRIIRIDRAKKQSVVLNTDFESIAKRVDEVKGKRIEKPSAARAYLQQVLQPHLNEMFFASKVVFVEGLEDVAYITSWLVLTGAWNDFRRHGAHIIPVHGKSLLFDPLVVSEQLKIPTLTIFDADGDKASEHARSMHEGDNKFLLSLLGSDSDSIEPFPSDTVWSDRFVQWKNNMHDTFKAEVNAEAWNTAVDNAKKNLEIRSKHFKKNQMFIGELLTELHETGTVPKSLEKLCKKILRFSSETP